MRTAIVAALGLILTATVLLPAQSTKPTDMPSPFGLHMGMMKDKLGAIKGEVTPYKYQLTSVTKPHPDIETYVVTVTPMAGLCFIRALSNTWKTTTDGAQLKEKFYDMKTQIEGIYGKPNVTDSLAEGSKLTRARDWMASLLEKERTLLARWSGADDNLPMLPTISKVYVGAYALNETSGYLVLEYYFTNYPQCQAEIIVAGNSKQANLK